VACRTGESKNRLPGAAPIGYAERMNGLLRHIEAFRRPVLPGTRIRLFLGDAPVGWVLPAIAAVLVELGARESAEGIVIADADALSRMGAALAERGLCRWRAEPFDVWSDADHRLVGTVDRGALPALGIRAHGVHVNGLVARPDGLHLWVARRRDDRPLDPGKLDHLCAGGIPAGLGPAETLVKEAQEEAAIPAAIAARAEPVFTVTYAIERAEGLRRDRLACYDLLLPEQFTPAPNDEEVAGFELWPIGRALRRVAETDDFKFNVNLVLIDLFLRKGLVDPASEAGRRLREGLDADPG
jgi:8-oxo-dGTP pyrophosphatase MutT (NUDIX family)